MGVSIFDLTLTLIAGHFVLSAEDVLQGFLFE
jgi:hypothetical protein